MKYSDLNLHLNKDVKTISIQPGVDINILKYLPIEDKNDIIQIALQNSEENGVYNLAKLMMYFRLYIIYLYADIEFTEEQKYDPAKLYDELTSNGIMDAILSNLEESEYLCLQDTLHKTMKLKLEYRNTIASVLNNFVENLPINATNAKDIIEKFNPADFQRVIDFATAANGGRPIN
jgi:hypothetical protein